MRRRILSRLVLSLAVLFAVFALWRFGTSRSARHTASRQPAQAAQAQPQPMHLLSRAEDLPKGSPASAAELAKQSPLTYRLSNTRQTVGQLTRNDKAILLENALMDTSSQEALDIPAHLRAQGDPGTYIVQARGPITEAFRAELRAAGVSILSYIPNNAYLVRASSAQADQLKAVAQAVLPYEPYYKIKAGLLGLAVKQLPLPEGTALNLLLFADASQDTEKALADLGATVIGRDRSPFGPVLRVVPPAGGLAALAGLPGVQEVERAHRRIPANDLSRVTLGISSDSVTSNSYLGLGGSNIWVNVNDTGIDTNHPDLQSSDSLPKVLFDTTNSAWDLDGHGTFVAGIIAGNGAESMTVSNAQGSIMPATNGQFRGKAPLAHLFSLSSGSDQYLQETAASQTNVLISNNSWTYGDGSYDLAAASYDAAVRDALSSVSGSQPLLFVFPSGNGGGMNRWDDGYSDGGMGGNADTILSPATAKNVITVGAIEQARRITNNVWYILGTNSDGTANMVTNQEWLPSSDSSNQVAGFSSRGNVGIGVEGDFGRFKPDVVAPGSAVISLRSTEWEQGAYYNPTNYYVISLTNVLVSSNSLYSDRFGVPSKTAWLGITLSPSQGSAALPTNTTLYIRFANYPTTNTYDYKTTNASIQSPGDLPLSPVSAYWYYAVGNPSSSAAFSVDLQIVLALTNQNGNFLNSLSNLNESIGPYYRYESGTSLAAAEASGTLALMEELLERPDLGRFSATNRPSPALMKAMLINGARALSSDYDFQVANAINHQGWGLINLPHTLPTVFTNAVATTSNSCTVLYFDQGPTNALSTGQTQTRYISLTPKAQGAPLRFTLVWTDPPGNPMAGVKLVNDLDLIVTNLDNGDVFVGNDILANQRYNYAWPTNSPIQADVINNVENVYLQAPLGSNYAVTVVGSRVNVNAVPQQTNNIVQDFALVISSDGTDTNSLTLTPTNGVYLTTLTNILPLVSVVTNQFVNSSNISGGVLTGQHAGASSPLLGTNILPMGNTVAMMGPVAGQITLGQSNQWHFYVLTNEHSWSNAAFLTFDPETLSVPRKGVLVADNTNATRVESDVDLYVSTDSDLTNLTTAAVAGAYKSLTRGGTETIVLTNANTSTIFYVGVKSEDMEAAEYGFMGVFSPNPFDDGSGDPSLIGFPAPIPIPDGIPQSPGVVRVFGVCVSPNVVRRVIVTNEVSHQLFGDLQGTLRHNRIPVVLNNHSPDGNVLYKYFVYDDSKEGDISMPSGVVATNWGAYTSDGPGNLNDFQMQRAAGQWQLKMADNAMGHIGTNESLGIKIFRMQDLTDGVYVTLKPGACWDGFVNVPLDATNLTVTATITSTDSQLQPVTGTAGPIVLTVCPAHDNGCLSDSVTGTNQTASVTFDPHTVPPINEDTYNVQVCNNGPVELVVFVKATLIYDLNGQAPVKISAGGVTPISDDAVTYSAINVTNDQKISEVAVGVRVDHPRVSDLVMHLISPGGKRILLDENRGGTSTNGMGGTRLTTITQNLSASGDWHPNTNVINTGATEGDITISWNFYQVPDQMDIYYEGQSVVAGAAVPLSSGSGTKTFHYGPGTSTQVTIVMDKDNTADNGTAWDYSITSTLADYLYFTFTEDTNTTVTPVKFAPTPFIPDLTPHTNLLSDFENTTSAVFTNGGWDFYATNGPVVVNGWTVLSNWVVVVSNTPSPSDGINNFLNLAGTTIQRLLPTIQDHNYALMMAVSNGANAHVTIYQGSDAPILTNLSTLSPTGTGWQTNTPLSFKAVASGTYVQITSQSTNIPIWLDNIQLVDLGGPTYVQAEDSLDDLKHSNAKGQWQLEVWDNRAGASNPPPQLLSWQLQFHFARSAPQPVPLVHRGVVSNSLAAGGIDYFSVNVPGWAAHATNWLTADSPGLNVYFNQFGAPIATNDLNNIQIMTNQTSQQFDISAVSTPSLAPGQTYYLAIVNTNAQTVNYGIQVDFNVTSLSNAVVFPSIGAGPISNTLYYGTGPRFFSYDPATNETMLEFHLYGLNGNADMVVSKELPFPDLNNYNLAFKAPGTNEEEVVALLNGDVGVNAPGGRWYIGLYNQDFIDVNYTIEVKAYTNLVPTIIPLTNGIPYLASTNLPVNYYSYVVTSNEVAVEFQVTNLVGGNGDLVLRRGLPLPIDALGGYDFASTNLGLASEQIIVTRNTGPVILAPGTWFAAVTNFTAGGTLSYSIVAKDVVRPGTVIIPLTRDVPYPNTNRIASGGPDYYRYTVSPGATDVEFVLNPISGDVNLVVSKNPPLPNLTTFDYGSFNPGLTPDVVLVLTNSTPVPLTAGDWYLAVYNASGADASYQIVASESVPVVTNYVTLTNGIAYRGTVTTNANGFGIDYYHYVVPANEIGDFFRLYGLSGNANLIVKKGQPLPQIVPFPIYNYGSFNPGTNDELVQIFTNSTPVPLSPGDWFIGVVNADTNSVSYQLLITNYVAPTNISSFVTLTNRVPYAAVNAGGASSNDVYIYQVSSNAARVQFEIDNPSGSMGLATHFNLPIPDLTTFDYISTNSGTNLELITIVTNSSPRPLAPGTWYLTAINLSGAPVSYSIKATEWGSAGRPISITGFKANASDNTLCLSWNSLPGAFYFVQAKTDLNESNWTTYAAVQATGSLTTYCVQLPSVFHYFRVGEGFANNSPLLNPNPTITSITRSADQVVIRWTALIYHQYQVQWTDSLIAPVTWTTAPDFITSGDGNFEFIDDGSETAPLGPSRFYRLQLAD